MEHFLSFFIVTALPFSSLASVQKFEILTEITSSETKEVTRAKIIVNDNEQAFLNVKNDAASDIERIIEISASDFRPGTSNNDISAKFNIKEVKNGVLSFDSSPQMIVTPNKSAKMTLYLNGKTMTVNVKANRL